MSPLEQFLAEHRDVTRRFFLRAGASSAAVAGLWPLETWADPSPQLAATIAELESYLTPPDEFRDVSRGKPVGVLHLELFRIGAPEMARVRFIGEEGLTGDAVDRP